MTDAHLFSAVLSMHHWMLFVICASNNSLFAVPPNQEFVYIQPQSQQGSSDLVKYYLDELHNSCQLTSTGSFYSVFAVMFLT